ncbi:unnamed protein product [Onchocerca ochengi]|uniref:Thyroglobulin type-1 domain-containing protein n=1 Tax=Onchocerca ochengi TaxID=42157 RepID=A0A182EU04_ONCOC|nr:unnamed protein product [Onchocerca ochengi]
MLLVLEFFKFCSFRQKAGNVIGKVVRNGKKVIGLRVPLPVVECRQEGERIDDFACKSIDRPDDEQPCYTGITCRNELDDCWSFAFS